MDLTQTVTWIPVSELPKDSGLYAVALQSGAVENCRFYTNTGWGKKPAEKVEDAADDLWLSKLAAAGLIDRVPDGETREEAIGALCGWLVNTRDQAKETIVRLTNKLRVAEIDARQAQVACGAMMEQNERLTRERDAGWDLALGSEQILSQMLGECAQLLGLSMATHSPSDIAPTIAVLQSELAKAREEREKAINDWQIQVNELRERMHGAREEIARLKSGNKDAESEIETDAQIVESLRAELTAARLSAHDQSNRALALQKQLTAANARAEKSEKEVDQWKAWQETTRQGGKIQRDTLRRQLAEAEANVKFLANQSTVCHFDRVCRERDSALAALEATREALRYVKKWAIWKPIEDALSLSPSTALREHNLKIAERAWKEGMVKAYRLLGENRTPETTNQLWLASDIRTELTKEKPNS